MLNLETIWKKNLCESGYKHSFCNVLCSKACRLITFLRMGEVYMLIATESRLYHIIEADKKLAPQIWAEDEEILAIAEAGPVCAAATANGCIRMWRKGMEWEDVETDIEERISSLMIVGADVNPLIIGTEPPHIYLLNATDDRPVRMDTFDRLECRKDWFTPWGGPPAVRSLAMGGESTVYADIHVGSIMRSFDLGLTWEPVNPTLHQDVHQVNTCPTAPDRVYANTADAVWISPDRGDSWQHRPFPHDVAYGRAIAIHPEEPDCVLASVSKGPHGDDVRGWLFRSDNAGRDWTHVTDGFPDYTVDNINTHRVTFDASGTAWAAVDKKLYQSSDRGKRWKVVWEAPAKIEKLETSV